MYLTGYKVVREWCGLYWSCTFALSKCNQYICNYNIGEWTKQKVGCGPLTLFDNYTFALSFISTISDKKGLVIFRSYYIPYQYTLEGVVGLWTPHAFFPIHRLPDGTVLAEKIKLEIEICRIKDGG